MGKGASSIGIDTSWKSYRENPTTAADEKSRSKKLNQQIADILANYFPDRKSRQAQYRNFF